MTLTLHTRNNEKAKALRKEGNIPAVVYGPSIKDNIHVFLSEKEFLTFEKRVNLYSTIIKYKDMNIVVKDIQKCILTDKPTHVDFFAIPDNKPFITKIPLHFINLNKNESIGVYGGMLQVTKFYVDLKIKSINHIPENITIDVSKLEKPTVTTNNITIPENTQLITKSQNLTLASVISASGEKKR